MKKQTKIIIGVVAGIVIIGSIAASADPKSKQTQNATVENAVPEKAETPKSDIVVTATQLNKDYQANEIAADEKYKGKTIEISGIVEGIEKDIMGEPFVTLTSGEFELGVHCSMENKNDAINLKKGQKVTFIGEGAGMALTLPMLNDCKLQ